MATLKTLVATLNNDLHSMVGNTVGSALDACMSVRTQVLSSNFGEQLRSEGLEDMVLFKDGIEDLNYIFLKTSPTDAKKIIKINVGIEYFNDASTEDGGILSRLDCELIGVGEEMKDASLAEIATTAQLAEVRKEKAEAKATLAKYQDAIAQLTKRIERCSAEEARLLDAIGAKN